ncbi:hypothetical protein Godav_012529 [Gossypium davidsonii]|uniref:Uncharacterized protein n=1 Tax=Gossypium davidsonii TaxID=34287 RepID=A0A7J8RDH0_GOSDV|nr:hypothetical protein [Gossypium davidsonii]
MSSWFLGMRRGSRMISTTSYALLGSF